MLHNLTDVKPLTGHWSDLSSNNLSDVLLDCYIPITERELSSLLKNNSEFFASPDKETVITFSKQNNAFVVIPLKEKYANEILNLQA